MKLEWAIGELILLAVAFYELWSLRRYDRTNAKTDRTNHPKEPPA